MSAAKPPDANKILRSLLVEARRTAGLKQTELAARLNKPQSYVSKVETGERQLNVIEFVAYARAIGLHPIALFSDLVMRVQSDSAD